LGDGNGDAGKLAQAVAAGGGDGQQIISVPESGRENDIEQLADRPGM
jgi:hypothetical protein